MCFVVASVVVILRRGDLTRQFNDFLDAASSPQYEMYFFLASTPMIAILVEKGQRYRVWIYALCLGAIIVSYFIGIRYYMFPFVGFAVWLWILRLDLPIWRRTLIATLTTVASWIVLTLWGIVRDLGVRDNPLSVFRIESFNSLALAIVVGNELPARLCYYDLMARLDYLDFFRGWEAIEATLLSFPYPLITRALGVSVPMSNSKLIYELQSGVIGSGVSTGATAFGNDWLTWGWSGLLVGGVIMGLILSLLDATYRRQGFAWLMVGPMATFQLIFFARGGTDVWLGIWGSFLPISLLLVGISFILDSLVGRFTRLRKLVSFRP
jgi:hypothetical protein